MAWGSEKSGIKFKAIGVSPGFHEEIRALAALEGRKMYEILDSIVLPVLVKRREKLSIQKLKGGTRG